MKHFLMKYNANKLETSKDEGLLTLEKARERILKLLFCTQQIQRIANNTFTTETKRENGIFLCIRHQFIHTV